MFRGSCAEKVLSGLHPTQYAIGTLVEFSDLGSQMALISLVWIWNPFERHSLKGIVFARNLDFNFDLQSGTWKKYSPPQGVDFAKTG